MSLRHITADQHSLVRPATVVSAIAAGVSLFAGSLFVTVSAQAETASGAAGASAATAPASLPIVTQDVSKLSAFDTELLRLMNVQRANAGLPALKEARGLSTLSTSWSTQLADAANAGKLAHNPNGFTDVTKNGSAKRKFWGENVIKWSQSAASAQAIFDAYIASATHKANILDRNFAYVGVGSYTNATGVSFNTINFTDAADSGQTYDPKAALTPLGHFESLTVSGATARVTGWGIDPDAPASTITVKDTSPDGTVATWTTTASTSRPELASSYPAFGAAHGFDYSFNVANSGDHNVCTTVVNAAGGLGNVDLGCLTMTVAPAPPVGSLDKVTSTPTAVTATGWAVDPGAPAAAANVTLTVANAAGTTSTTVAAKDTYASDVAGAGKNHGFTFTAPITNDGTTTVCATAVSTRTPATTTDLGCKTVTTANLNGNLDSVSEDSAGPAARTARIRGWALDLGSPTTAATVAITVTAPNGTTSTTSTVANAGRSDVGRAYAAPVTTMAT